MYRLQHRMRSTAAGLRVDNAQLLAKTLALCLCSTLKWPAECGVTPLRCRTYALSSLNHGKADQRRRKTPDHILVLASCLEIICTVTPNISSEVRHRIFEHLQARSTAATCAGRLYSLGAHFGRSSSPAEYEARRRVTCRP